MSDLNTWVEVLLISDFDSWKVKPDTPFHNTSNIECQQAFIQILRDHNLKPTYVQPGNPHGHMESVMFISMESLYLAYELIDFFAEGEVGNEHQHKFPTQVYAAFLPNNSTASSLQAMVIPHANMNHGLFHRL